MLQDRAFGYFDEAQYKCAEDGFWDGCSGVGRWLLDMVARVERFAESWQKRA